TFDIEFKSSHPGYAERHFEALVQFNPGLLDRPAFIVNYRDITERKHVHAQLLRFERMATVGEMAAGLAHELRNPLLAMSATAENLLAERGLGREQRADMEIILKQ